MTIGKALISVVLAMPAVIAGTFPAWAADDTTYRCDTGAEPFIVTIIAHEGRAQVDGGGMKRVFLDPAPNGIYQNDEEGMAFELASGPPTLWGGDAGFVCERLVADGEPDGGNATMLNIAGQSLGGNVRSGPGVNFADIGSLAEFTPVTIIANTGVHFNGYDWFEIQYNGRTAYQWGGIMCANGGTPGILVACENARELLYPDTGLSDSSFSGARSWGGNVRSGPGADYARLGSIAEGVPVTVVRNTGVSFNGYDWYEIEFNGQTGFHWGGIMCSDNDNLPGSFSPCTNNPEL